MLRAVHAFILFVFVGFIAGGCSSSATAPAIDGAKARVLVANGALLIDVRSGIEYWWSHIEGAVNISSGSLPAEMKKFDKARPIVVYSRSGARSATARDLLASAGFEAYDLGAKSSW